MGKPGLRGNYFCLCVKNLYSFFILLQYHLSGSEICTARDAGCFIAYTGLYAAFKSENGIVADNCQLILKYAELNMFLKLSMFY